MVSLKRDFFVLSFVYRVFSHRNNTLNIFLKTILIVFSEPWNNNNFNNNNYRNDDDDDDDDRGMDGN